MCLERSKWYRYHRPPPRRIFATYSTVYPVYNIIHHILLLSKIRPTFPSRKLCTLQHVSKIEIRLRGRRWCFYSARSLIDKSRGILVVFDRLLLHEKTYKHSSISYRAPKHGRATNCLFREPCQNFGPQ